MELQIAGNELSTTTLPSCNFAEATAERKWYAVFTFPKHEKSVVRHLEQRGVESFLPTYEEMMVWKNRQRVKVIRPLFPSYLFVLLNGRERVPTLQAPGVIKIVGNSREAIALPASEIEFLRAGFRAKRFEPYRELAVGQRVRIKSGVMQGVCGTLVRKSNALRFVLTLEMINQSAAIEVGAEDLELLPDSTAKSQHRT